MDTLGVLYKPSPKLNLPDAVQQAITNFENAPHTRDQFPAEARFNPQELPNKLEICGLTTVPDPDVRPGYIRITIHTLTPEAKRAYERANVALQVEAQAA